MARLPSWENEMDLLLADQDEDLESIVELDDDGYEASDSESSEEEGSTWEFVKSSVKSALLSLIDCPPFFNSNFPHDIGPYSRSTYFKLLLAVIILVPTIVSFILFKPVRENQTTPNLLLISPENRILFQGGSRPLHQRFRLLWTPPILLYCISNSLLTSTSDDSYFLDFGSPPFSHLFVRICFRHHFPRGNFILWAPLFHSCPFTHSKLYIAIATAWVGTLAGIASTYLLGPLPPHLTPSIFASFFSSCSLFLTTHLQVVSCFVTGRKERCKSILSWSLFKVLSSQRYSFPSLSPL